jgi:hypothetical protein
MIIGQAQQTNYGTDTKDLEPVMRALRASGETLQGIADRLNALGHTTRGKRPWNHVHVKRTLDRAALQPAAAV